jgi:hypothetical protein
MVVVMGSFAQRWWFRYLIDCPNSRVLPVLAAPYTSSRARISKPRFERDICAAMIKTRQAAPGPRDCGSQQLARSQQLRESD